MGPLVTAHLDIVAIYADADQLAQRRLGASGRSDRGRAEHGRAVVEHGGLAPRDASRRAVQPDQQVAVIQPAGRTVSLAVRAQLYLGLDRLVWRRAARPDRADRGELVG